MSFIERLVHMLLFEALLLLLMTAVVVFFTHHEALTIAGLGLGLSLIAMLWNLLYNWAFDAVVTGKREQRGIKVRLLHAVIFEGVLLVVTLPIVAWALAITWREAFFLDIGLTLLTVAYTFCFNWIYDLALLRWHQRTAIINKR